jgi:phosphopantothenoylcysteine decarboxylase / phosphopantothenate---cysteine ligase
MKVLVTAGPTREALDPVRFISNRSSGKMGVAVAAAALRAGHEVVLVAGPISIAPPDGARVIPVTTAAEMLVAVKQQFRACDVCVMAAAVADWRPKHVANQKCKKADGPPQIEWEPTVDILKALRPLQKKSQVVCGFAAETTRIAQEAKRKLREKNLDAVAANDVSQKDRGFESDSNALTLYLRDGKVRRRTRVSKMKCAEWLMRVLEEIFVQKKMQ